MSADRAFVDTNLFVYLYSDDEPDKKNLVRTGIDRYERLVSTQVLNEISNVCLRKLGLPVAAVRTAITEIITTCSIVTIDETTVSLALDVHERYGYSYYDSLIVASALESGCAFLLTEDMSDGQTIDGTLTITNIIA